jgi:hypothetical protein
VRESDRVKPRPPPSKLPPVDIVNWSIPECKTPTWRGERKCGRRKGTAENIDKQNKGLALLAWAPDVCPAMDGLGLQYRIESIDFVGTNLHEEYMVTIFQLLPNLHLSGIYGCCGKAIAPLVSYLQAPMLYLHDATQRAAR